MKIVAGFQAVQFSWECNILSAKQSNMADLGSIGTSKLQAQKENLEKQHHVVHVYSTTACKTQLRQLRTHFECVKLYTRYDQSLYMFDSQYLTSSRCRLCPMQVPRHSTTRRYQRQNAISQSHSRNSGRATFPRNARSMSNPKRQTSRHSPM